MRLTYFHTSNVTGKVFYVGCGSKLRPGLKATRSPEWKAIADLGYKIDIAAVWETQDQAFEHEKLLIACFRDMGHPLVNKAAGGRGCVGVVHQQTTREKMREAHLGERNHNFGKKFPQETREKMSRSMTGRKGPMGMLGKIQTSETRLKMKASHQKSQLVKCGTCGLIAKAIGVSNHQRHNDHYGIVPLNSGEIRA